MEVTRQERCSYVKIAVLLSRNAKECHSELTEALGNRALPTVHKILRKDLHMHKIAAKWVPHALTEQQKWCRYETYRIHLEMYQNEGENLLNNIITIDETWVRAYEPEIKCQSAEWRHEGSLGKERNFVRIHLL